MHIEGDERFDHIVSYRLFLDGDSKALCGRKPFPEKWREGGTGRKPCPTCVGRLR